MKAVVFEKLGGPEVLLKSPRSQSLKRNPAPC